MARNQGGLCRSWIHTHSIFFLYFHLFLIIIMLIFFNLNNPDALYTNLKIKKI